MLKKRIFTALILIPIVVALVIYLPPRAFLLLTAFVSLAATWEWSRLMEIKTGAGHILYLILMCLFFFNSLFIPSYMILLVAGIWWLIALLLVGCYPRLSASWGRGVMLRGIMGVMVLLPCWRALNYIRNQEDGVYALLFLFVLIWGADTAAYFVGKKWGRKPLAAKVSPGKTVQGVIGALVFTVVVTFVVMWLCQTPRVIMPWGILLSLLTVIFSIVGDLFESALKRKAGLKDSGNLLPGHGGLLDRIDSLTAAAPIFALGALLLGMYLR